MVGFVVLFLDDTYNPFFVSFYSLDSDPESINSASVAKQHGSQPRLSDGIYDLLEESW